MSPRGLHGKIVYEILPKVAERLKKEGVISSYDRKQFSIPLVKGSVPITINPDLVVYLPDNRKVVVEITNPRKPKRFIGELVYPHFLGYLKRIEAAIVFVLQYGSPIQRNRGMVQQIGLDLFFEKQIPSIPVHLDAKTPEAIEVFLYHFLYHSLTDYQRLGRFLE